MQKEMNANMMISNYYVLLGIILLDLKDYNRAQNYIEKALELSQKNNQRWNEGIHLICLGNVLGKKEKPEYEGAKECMMKGIKILDELEIRPFLSQGYLYLGELYNKMGQKDEASKYLKKAEGMFNEMEMNYYIHKTQDALTNL